MPHASPELQERYEDLAARALMYLYQDDVARPLLEVVRSHDEPQEGLGEAGALLFARLKSAVQRTGRDVPPEMEFALGAEIIGNLAEIATEAGVHDFMGNQKDLEGAWYLALDRFRAMEEAAGSLDPVQAQQDAEILREANQSGELEKTLEAMESPESTPETPVRRGLMGGM